MFKAVGKELGMLAVKGLVFGVGALIGCRLTNEVANAFIGKPKVGEIDVNLKTMDNDNKKEG